MRIAGLSLWQVEFRMTLLTGIVCVHGNNQQIEKTNNGETQLI